MKRCDSPRDCQTISENNAVASDWDFRSDEGFQGLPEPGVPACDDTEAERLQALFDSAFPDSPPRLLDRAEWSNVYAWRGMYGSSIKPTGEFCRSSDRAFCQYTPGKGMELPPNLSTVVRAISPAAAIALARKLDAVAAPSWYASDPALRAVDIKRLVAATFRNAQKRAAKAGTPFEISPEDADRLLWAQEMRCAVSGLEFRADAAGSDGFRAPFRPSLDRISSSKGYVRGNVRLVLTLVNLALNDWGDAALIEVARAIAANHPARP